MAIINAIDNRYARLVYYTDERLLHHTFHRDLDSKTLRDVLNIGVDFLRDHGATKWLSDNRAIEPHSEEDTHWINTNWLPRAIAAGWKSWALVVPYDVKARMNMVEFVNSFYEQGVRVMVFTELDRAHDWLRQAE